MAWISLVQSRTCPYIDLIEKIQTSTVTHKEFEDEILKLSLFDPLIIPTPQEEDSQDLPSILTAALSNKTLSLARYIIEKFPVLLGLVDEIDIFPLTDLMTEIFGKMGNIRFCSEALSFLTWAVTHYPKYLNVISPDSPTTLVFNLLMQLEIKTTSNAAMSKLAIDFCVVCVQNGGIVWPPILQVQERDEWPKFSLNVKNNLQVLLPPVLINIIVDYSQSFWSLLMPFSTPELKHYEHCDSLTRSREKFVRRFLKKVVTIVWGSEDDEIQKKIHKKSRKENLFIKKSLQPILRFVR